MHTSGTSTTTFPTWHNFQTLAPIKYRIPYFHRFGNIDKVPIFELSLPFGIEERGLHDFEACGKFDLPNFSFAVERKLFRGL